MSILANPSADARAANAEAAEQLFATLPPGRLLLKYQATALARLRAGVQLLVIEKSRRIGLTWGLASFAGLKAAALPSAGGDNVFYMGYEQEMAREFIDACAMWCRAYGIAAGAVGEDVFEDIDAEGNTQGIKAFRIVLASGFKITALSSMPRAFRGKQGTVILDEAAFHGQLKEKIKAALALLMWGGQVVIVSTHDGVANEFNQLIDRIRAGQQKGEVITISFDDAIADGLYERIAEVAAIRGRKVPAKADWIADIRDFYGDNADEELDVIPKQGGGSWIKPGDLAACEDDDAGIPENYAGGLYYMGRDVARRRDGAIIWGCELVGQTLVLRDRIKLIGATFAEQAARADWLIQNRRMAAYWIDQGGMGEQPVEDAQRAYGESRVQGQLLIGQNRLDIGVSIRDRFERQLWRVPRHPEIRADLLAIKQLPSSGGAVRIGDDPKGNVHADEFWAGALASRAADLPPMAYDYRPAKAAPARGPDGRGRMSMRPNHSGDMTNTAGRRGAW